MKLRRTGTLRRFRAPAGQAWSRSEIHRHHRYGVTPEEYAATVRDQENACAICKRPFGASRNVHQDHDHATGQVRGVLCRDCNMAIGSLERTGIPAVWLDQYLDDWKLYAEEEPA